MSASAALRVRLPVDLRAWGLDAHSLDDGMADVLLVRRTPRPCLSRPATFTLEPGRVRETAPKPCTQSRWFRGGGHRHPHAAHAAKGTANRRCHGGSWSCAPMGPAPRRCCHRALGPRRVVLLRRVLARFQASLAPPILPCEKMRRPDPDPHAGQVIGLHLRQQRSAFTRAIIDSQ